MKKILLFAISLLSFFGISFSTFAENTINIEPTKIEFSVFSRENCTHCIALKKFLNENSGSLASPKYYDIDIKENKKLFDVFTTKNKISKVTPIILIGDKIILGFEPETTGKMLLEKINALKESSYFENYDNSKSQIEKSGEGCDDVGACSIQKKEPFLIKIPFFGVIDLQNYSLIFLATILGFVDGFNPCAMWVLIMFLSILSQTGSRKKMMQVAGIFILAEAIMYFAILNVWYKTWDFVQLDNIMTPLVGVISFGAGIFFLYEFFTSKEGECKVISGNQKKKTIDRIKMIASKPMTIGIFFLTILIAFSVNVVEFACSIGIPQAFTKLLELSSLGFIAKQFYILLYTVFYMADDFVVFGVALYAFTHIHLATKYSRYCQIVGGVLMLILGYLFIFNPALLKMII